jgi:cytochrome oxidase Cu insertion factor (SCO1/SenC/PrrC family)
VVSLRRFVVGRRARTAVTGLVLAGLAGGLLAACSSSPPAPPASLGIVQNRPVPTTTLVTEQGRPTTLAAYRGKYVVMAPFLSLCQDECPLVTGAFLAMQRDVQAAGLGGQVVFLEVSVDPWRDSPARLTAYAKRFGADWPLLTGTLPNLTTFWKQFDVYFAQVPEEQPAMLDWWTGQPLTFDVDHTDGFILLDRSGHERFITVEPPNLHGRLEPGLRKLLDAGGLKNLDDQTANSWTIPQALAALSWLVGKTIPATST